MFDTETEEEAAVKELIVNGYKSFGTRHTFGIDAPITGWSWYEGYIQARPPAYTGEAVRCDKAIHPPVFMEYATVVFNAGDPFYYEVFAGQCPTCGVIRWRYQKQATN